MAVTAALASLLAACGSVPLDTPSPATAAATPAPASALAPTRASSSPLPAEAATASTATASTSPSSTAPTAADELERQRAFERWVAGFVDGARAKGIDDATLHAAFDDVRLRPRVIEGDRAQPEFVRAVWDYLDTAVSAKRVATGQEKLATLRATVDADALTGRYGVPAPLVVAVWGLESNYGTNMGDVPVFDALATLGFEGRREAWARGQLMDALRILQHGDVDRAHLVGSWAGAMGQTQFLPSTYLDTAIDADGDGRRDIWGSLPDVLASTARFLQRAGWRANEPWGVEVALPAGFDPARADPSVRQSSASWSAEGLRTVDGGTLPDLDDATVLQPAGVRGPAFLVGANFRALLRYNNSTSYALAVGLLSQRLSGGPGVQAAWPRDEPPLTRAQLQSLQAALSARGFDAGTADGVMGPATRDALRRWQRSVGLPPDGFATRSVLQRLQDADPR